MTDTERAEKERSILAGIQALTEMRLRPETDDRMKREADRAIIELQRKLATLKEER